MKSQNITNGANPVVLKKVETIQLQNYPELSQKCTYTSSEGNKTGAAAVYEAQL